MFAHLLVQRWLVLLALLFFLFSLPLTAFGQRADSAGIGLRPAWFEEPAEPSETKTYSVQVSNLSNNRQTYYLFTRDIVSVTGDGTPVFADEDQEKTGFELTGWVSLDKTEVTLDAGSTESVEVTIEVPENATPGSHFGAVFVTLTPPRMRSSGAAVGYEVAHVISLRVAGEAVENAQIRSFSTDNYIHSEPVVDFRARVENKGTVLVRPTGPLEIYNMFGNRVAMVTFNESKAGIFPFTTREFSMRWEDEGPAFGRYQAVLSMLYGEQGRQSTISSTLSFWVLPMNIIGPALGVLALLLLGSYIAVRVYIRRAVATASGNRRLVRRRRGSNGVPVLLTVAVVMLGVTALFLIILLALFA